MAKPGDTVKLHLNEGILEGVLMPQEGDAYFIKRSDGYNQGVKKSRVKRVEVVAKAKPRRMTKTKVKGRKGRRIVVLHTGGTIASNVDYQTGGVQAQLDAEHLVAQVPELSRIATIEAVTFSNVMSEDMRIANYSGLAKKVAEHLDADGIIIPHGTDTLHYTAAALAFALQDCPKPVILVGSQRSSDRGSSDAAMNLLCAAQMIAKSDFAGVAICMHHHAADDVCAILPPTRTRKFHTSRRDAFRSVGVEPYAFVDVKGKVTKKAGWQAPRGDLLLRERFEEDVAMVIAHPSMRLDVLKAALNAKGVIIQGTGLGHMPINGKNEPLFKAVADAIDKGAVVAMTSQCIFGRTHPSVYSNLRRLSDAGVIFCQDMLPETALVKLSWLLASGQESSILGKNLRGEILPRSLYEEEFV